MYYQMTRQNEQLAAHLNLEKVNTGFNIERNVHLMLVLLLLEKINL